MNLYNKLQQVARSFPTNKAISDERKTLSYRELVAEIKKNQKLLRSRPHTCGLIYLPKCVELVAWQLALNSQKMPFITLEWNQEKRKDECIEQSQPSCMITLIDGKIEVINFENYKTYPKEVGYIVFSSGSTGTPKQILMKDYPIIDVVTQQAKITQFDERGVFLWLLNSAFDASLSDIYMTLYSGGHLVVTKFNALEIKPLLKLIKQYNVTHTDIPPIVFSIWLKLFQQQQITKSLNHIIFGGEIANENLVRNLLSFTNLYNAYGPTETTICSSMCKVNDDWTAQNVGKPLIGVLYKLIAGELHIGGEHCSLGYNNEKLNDKFYFENNNKWFITGDLFDEINGIYYYKGRKDRQFKYNGQLICPEELEIKAKKNGAKNAQIKYQNNKIILYYDGEIQKDKFENDLVSWMKPHFYKKMDSIENNINSNWKLKVYE